MILQYLSHLKVAFTSSPCVLVPYRYFLSGGEYYIRPPPLQTGRIGVRGGEKVVDVLRVSYRDESYRI